jgi:protein disulfide isomerase
MVTSISADLVRYLREERDKQGLEENPVITLTNDNFDDIITTSELFLVEFYTDLCVPCQRLEPVFADAARQLQRETPPIRLGRVQIPDQMKVAERFPLEGYPLLIIFRHGAQYNYTGPKETASGIVEYMKQQSGPSSIPLEQTADVKKFINRRAISVVGYFHEDTDSVLLREFRESGNLVRTEMELGHTHQRGVAQGMDQEPDTIVVYHPVHLVSPWEKGLSVISSPPSDASQLRQLYLEHARPIVGQMTTGNRDNLYSHRPLLVAYYDVDWSSDGFKATQYWHDLVASVARDFISSGVVFATANEEDFLDDIRSVGLSEWGEDVTVTLYAPGPLKYPMTEELSPESLTSFIQDYLDGELVPHFSSEPVPKPVKGALIRKVVGSNYLNEVGNTKKDVVVMLCRPSLPDCREAAEFYKKLATQFRGVKNLVFTEMNVALNDPPVGTDISSLPSFLFSPRGSHDVAPVTPRPKDDADLAFFLKYKQNIKPLKSKKKDEL